MVIFGKKSDEEKPSSSDDDDIFNNSSSSSSLSKPNKPTKVFNRPKSLTRRSSLGEIPASSSSNKPSKASKRKNFKRQSTGIEEPTMDDLPELISDLESADGTPNERPARALRLLFALSEHGDNENRTEMVVAEDGRLVPALLHFLEKCTGKSSEQYLALLVLNNISIPAENKSVLALDNGGARVFARMLCDDPSCHLLAIILVNLTFADSKLRKELVTVRSGIGLVESLAFALRVASLTSEEYEARKSFIGCSQDIQSPGQRLATLMADDQRLRPSKSALSFQRGNALMGDWSEVINDPSKQLYPETALWCLSALKNLTRPCKDATAAHILIKSGVFSLILQYITISGEAFPDAQKLNVTLNSGSQSSSSISTPTAVDPTEEYTNSPSSWDSSSMQDAALYIVLNLSACSASRDYVFEAEAVGILSAITDFPSVGIHNKSKFTAPEQIQQEFQCLKARMALSYLVGSEGNFGQSKINSIASTVHANRKDSVLVMSDSDIKLLIELLANTVHQRGKEGPGGYSVATFNIKYVLYALRCLLTHSLNQERVADICGRKLNALLMKVLAMYSTRRLPMSMDAEAAEYAVFSLYLQSSYGFQKPFLPSMFTEPTDEGALVAKVLTTYMQHPKTTPAGSHAAGQILLRLKYLKFEGELEELVGEQEIVPSVEDLGLGNGLLSILDEIHVEERNHGVEPREEIFGRPILRTRKPKKGGDARPPWDNRANISTFSSALIAVQQLSYGSAKVRHANPIDDILIANNIAATANGETNESYNFLWSWEDTASEIQRNLERQGSTESRTRALFNVASPFGRNLENGPSTLFGFTCVPFCTDDTTSW